MDERPCSTAGSLESKACTFNDSDLLVSVFMKNIYRPSEECSTQNRKPVKKCVVPRQSHKRNWSTTGSRTVLAWLIHSRVVSLNEVVQFRSPKDDAVLKEGLVTRDGLVCICCNDTYSISEFEIHAGFKSGGPCMNLVMESSGKPLALCQLEAWSAEYKARKAPFETSLVEEGDDLCGRCGLEGELVCCDNCPAAFHQTCLFEQIPEGNWYCLQCRCLTCWEIDHKIASPSRGNLKCSMCKNRYHETCMKGKYANTELTSTNWFCGQSCYKVCEGLRSRIGLTNHHSGEISWRLLQCINGDNKAHSSQDFVMLKAECNSKLAVAITLIEEYFDQMLDRITNIDMIPQAIFNWGSQFPRLNFEGFYTVILEKKDVVVSVASIRIHGAQVAELHCN